MGLGILPDKHLDHVPGTSFMNEKGVVANIEDVPASHSNLKHDPTGKIVLVPQPSDDPNDPLNWPRWKKEMFTVSIIIGCGAVGAVGPLLSPAIVPLAMQFDIPMQRFTLGFNGASLIGLAVGNLFCNSLAMMIGKRPVYLITALGLFLTTLWSAVANDFVSLAVSRALQGVCISPMEALIPASIAEIWFVHERGFRNAVFNLGVLGGVNLASPIAGPIIDKAGYKAALWGMTGAFGLQLLLTIFFMPETTYDRSTQGIPAGQITKDGSLHEKSPEDVKSTSVPDTLPPPKAHSYLYTLRPWSRQYKKDKFWYNIIAPFRMLASPLVIWGSFQLTICMSWLVLLVITLSQIFSGPPYNFSVTAVGLASLASSGGILIATVLAGFLVDGLVKFMSRKNKGIYEPEFRLPIVVLLTTLSGAGFFAWGQSLHNAEKWPIPVILCLGMINLGVQFGIVGVVSYVVDSHRHEAVEAYAMMSFCKNVFAFAMTFYVNDWIASQGVRETFFVVGGITIAVSSATLPMYIYGKRARSFAHRMGLMRETASDSAEEN